MLEDMIDDSESHPIDMDQAKIEQALKGDRNFSISCELGVRYPTLKACQSHTLYDRARQAYNEHNYKIYLK